MDVIEKISHVPLDEKGVTRPVPVDPGRLVFDPEAPDTLRFEGKKETIVIGPVRDVSAEKALVRIKYGKPEISDAAFLDYRAGSLKARRQAAILVRDIQEGVQIDPLTEEEAQLYAAKRQGARVVDGMKMMRAGRKRMGIGGVAVLLAALVTGISYVSADIGERYFFFSGVILVGAVIFIQGLAAYLDGRKLAGGRGLPSISSDKAPRAAAVGLTDIAGMVARGDVEGLVAALAVNELEVRIQAMAALRDLQDPRTLDLLLPRLRDRRWDVRWTAAEALGKLGDGRAIEPLSECLGDENALVRAAAEDSIRALQAVQR